MYIKPESVHDVNGLDQLTYETGGYYIMDRGYIDLERLSVINQHKIFFINRAKNKLQLKTKSAEKANKSTGVLCNQRISLKGFYSNQ
jgi:hypothetical protein